MPLAVSAQHSALKPRVLSLKLGCFSVDWSLGGVNPVGVGVYWCSSCLPVVVVPLKVATRNDSLASSNVVLVGV